MWVLIGIAVLVTGFLIRLNPLLVIATAALATGLAAGMGPVEILSAFGKAFNDSRYVSVFLVVLPVIGLLERFGLQERARMMIKRLRQATTARILFVYLLARQLLAAVGLASVGGHAQMVRPLLAPMAEGAAEREEGTLPDKTRYLIRAHAAAVDNIGVFFGEDIFLAMSSVLLIKGFLDTSGVIVEPLQISVWAIPTAIAAFLIHAVRLFFLGRRLEREGAVQSEPRE